MKKQDSYTLAIEEESDPEDYIDKEINRKIALKRTETVKTVVKECINENDDILFKIKRRARAEQEAMKKFKVDVENDDNEQIMIEDSNANIRLTPKQTDNVDNRLANVTQELKAKGSKGSEEELPDLEAGDVAAAAVLIQSAFKGFKVRKELDEMKAFHRNMSQPICEEQSPKPQHKTRQNSYMEAVCSPPDSFADEPTKRSWKTRQESYNEAINQEENGKNEDWKKRQNSYLQAIGSSMDIQPQTQEIVPDQTKSTNKNIRQDSYQKAVTSISPNTSISEDSKKESKFKKRQDSYQQAVDSLSEKSKSEPAYKKRQSSYQKAMSDNSTISENQKNIKNNKNKEKKDAASKEEKQKKQKNQEPKLGAKLKKEKSTEKKKSKSPRRIPESYQRPPSSSDEEEKSASLKRTHKPRGVAKKQSDKLKPSDSKSGPTISTFSAAADVVNAAIRIQLAWRGYRARCEIREHHDSLEIVDIEEEMLEETKTRKQKKKGERRKGDERGAWADVVNSCITIQRAYRKYHRNKTLREIGVDDCEKAEDAIVKIQAHFKGFQARKRANERAKEEVSKVKVERASSKVVKNKTQHKSKVSKPVVNLGITPRKRPLRTETYVVEDPYIKKAGQEDLPDLQLQEVADATVKIQAAYRGFKTRQQIQKRSAGDVVFSVLIIQRAFKRYKARKARKESLPDIDDSEVQKATITIQSAYRGFKTRKEAKKKSACDVIAACLTIQRAFKRYKSRKMIKNEEIKAKQVAVEKAKKEAARAKEIKDKPHPKEPMTSNKRRQRHDSQLQTPRAQKGFVTHNEQELKIKKEAVTYFGNLVPGENGQMPVSKKTHIPSPLAAKDPKKITSTVKLAKVSCVKNELPDLRDKDVQNSAVLIQAAYRGYQIRKKKRSMADVIHSALVIQSAFRRYKARKESKNSELPDLKADDVVAASIKIQAAYKGFKTRKMMKKKEEDDLPDLNAADVAQAAVKIQSVYKGFKTRKMIMKKKKGDPPHDELPDIGSKDVQEATLKIQSCYRGFKTRKQLENNKQKVLKKKKSKSSSSSDSEIDAHKTSSDSSDSESENVKKRPSHRKAENTARRVVSRVPESSATESDAMESLPETDTDIEISKRVPDSSATESEGGNLSEDSDSETPARKNVRNGKEMKKKKRRVDDILISAIIIQRSYRRYKTRKEKRKKAAIAHQQQKLSNELQRRTSQVK